MMMLDFYEQHWDDVFARLVFAPLAGMLLYLGIAAVVRGRARCSSEGTRSACRRQNDAYDVHTAALIRVLRRKAAAQSRAK